MYSFYSYIRNVLPEQCGIDQPTYNAIIENMDTIFESNDNSSTTSFLILRDVERFSNKDRIVLYYQPVGVSEFVAYSQTESSLPNTRIGYKGYLFVPYGEIPENWERDYSLEPLDNNIYCYTQRST